MAIALVLGDAKCVHEDAARACQLFQPDVVCATNNIGIDWPGKLDYWCTLHPKRCPDWVGIPDAMTKRLAAGRNRPQVWAHKAELGVDRHTPEWSNGSSGLLCVKVLLQEGFRRIVLAGVPMTNAGGHFYNDRVWNQGERYRRGWRDHMAEIAPYVRSVSGWTMETFGEPTQDWLVGDA